MKHLLHNALIYGLFLSQFIYGCSKTEAPPAVNADVVQEIIRLVLQKTNALRASEGLSPLAASAGANRVAQYHSDNMVAHEFFSHIDHEGTSPSDRATALGVSWTAIAENIANVPWHENVSSCGDTRTAEALANCMVEGWKNSPGHYRNMMGAYTELGVGISFSKDNIVFGTQVFRTP
jgi:uncharacterized protein YkwD